MPKPDPGRDSRRSSKSGPTSNETHKSSSERRSKAKSAQISDARRRPSQAEVGLSISAQRPDGKSRTNSAPLVQTISEPGLRDDIENGDKPHARDLGSENRNEGVVAIGHGQDEDEVAGAVGAFKHFQPFRNHELSEPLPDINVAVIGADRAGKSTFIQNALGLPFPSDSPVVERKIAISGRDYLLRVLEISIDDVDVDDDDTVGWPETIEDKIMPQIDGVLTLYDVKDQGSLENVLEMLNAINEAAIPSLLVACKCDAPPEEHVVNPRVIEQTAKRQVKDLETLRVSANARDTHKKGISMILRAIVSPENGLGRIANERRSPSPRHRAQSNAVPSLIPQPPHERGHSRAASELTGALYKSQGHAKHDSKLASYNSSDRLQVHNKTSQEDMRGSFLIEESASEASEESFRDIDGAEAEYTADLKTNLSSAEEGFTFNELVDRLLAQPTSKADNKFAAIFLALYRKFAAPGELLEAIVQRFDDLERQRDPYLLKTTSQLRVLSILEQWVGTYPGDFAYPRTQRRMRTFVGKLSHKRIFSAAAKEINADIDVAREDDDTNWAFCDRDRASRTGDFCVPLSKSASILIDDPSFLDGFLLSPTPMEDDTKTLGGAEADPNRSVSSSSLVTQHTASAENAQKQVNLLQPFPRQPMTKIQWRTLMEIPDDVVARELTRIDWIMFCSIRPRDLVRQVSLTGDQKADCKNLWFVNRMIEHFNQLAFWVENFILLRDKPKHRALMLEKFMRIARKLRELNNYNALGAVIAGVKSSAVHRLGATRELIPPAIGKDWMKLEILMQPTRSYSSYRLAWENSSTERIPYLPLHRRDLVSAEAGNKTFIGDEEDGKINWKKFEIMGEVIVSIQKAQGVPYKSLGGVRGNEQVRDLVLDVKLIKDEDELFARSKQIEPSGTPALGTTAKFKELFKR